MSLLTSMVAGRGFILVDKFLLQNLIRLGSEVGLAYQSPPPLYFNKAISRMYSYYGRKKQIKTKILLTAYH